MEREVLKIMMSDNNNLKIKILFCDHHPYRLQAYKNFLYHIAKAQNVTLKIMTYTNEEVLLFLAEEEKVQMNDLLILNVQYEKNSGVDVAKKLKGMGYKGEILFIADRDIQVMESLEVRPISYLLHDEITLKKLEETILPILHFIKEKQKQKIFLDIGKQKREFWIECIEYIDIKQGVLGVNEIGGNTEHFYGTLRSIEEQVRSNSLIRVHRLYIVNLKHIVKIEKAEIMLSSRVNIPVGEKYMKSLLAKIEQDGDINCRSAIVS